MTEQILTAKNITVAINNKTLYSNVNFELFKNHNLVIIGKNGVGKTTLIHALLDNANLKTGQFTWHIDKHNYSYVPQFRPKIQSFPITIKEFVALAFDEGFFPFLSKKEQKQLNHIISDMNLTSIQNNRIDTASGGEKQRAYIAQALIKSPSLLILDEATANLDSNAKHELMNALAFYQSHHDLSILMISHDFEIIKKYSSHYLLLDPKNSIFDETKNLESLDFQVID